MTRRAGRHFQLVVLALTAAGLFACARGPEADVERAFERGDYREAIALARHALRSGEAPARIHLYYGLALLATHRDHEGLPELDVAVAADSGLADLAAAYLWSAEAAGREDAARRWRRAIELDPSIDPRERRFAIAGDYYDARECTRATSHYAAAVRAFPDTAACEQAYARLAECWTELGEPEKAREAMNTLVSRYPRGRFAGGVSSNLDDIRFGDAEAALAAGDYAKAIELAGQVVQRAPNRLLQQRARFVLGQAYQATGDRARAYDEFSAIVRADRGESGRIVEQARARMIALQEAGVD